MSECHDEVQPGIDSWENLPEHTRDHYREAAPQEHVCSDGLTDWGVSSDCPNCQGLVP